MAKISWLKSKPIERSNQEEFTKFGDQLRQKTIPRKLRQSNFMPVIELDTRISVVPEICYKLSLSVDLHKLSAGSTGEHIVGGVKSGIMKEGDVVTWKARHFGIWQTLSTKITQEIRYECFVDEMIDGAFESMRHEHFFTEYTDGTLMKDVFKFESPLGIFGKLFNVVILNNYMREFLLERNRKLKEVAESDMYGQFL